MGSIMRNDKFDSLGRNLGKIPINKIIFKLVLLGCISLMVCIVLGVLCVQLLGWSIDKILTKYSDKLFGMSNYVSDFLGGALGLTTGLLLDKICIEKINNMYHYKALTRVILNEMYCIV